MWLYQFNRRPSVFRISLGVYLFYNVQVYLWIDLGFMTWGISQLSDAHTPTDYKYEEFAKNISVVDLFVELELW